MVVWVILVQLFFVVVVAVVVAVVDAMTEIPGLVLVVAAAFVDVVTFGS